MGEGRGGDVVGGVEVLHGVVETVTEGGDQRDGSAKPGSAGDVVRSGIMKAMAEELAESFAGLVGDGTVGDGGKVIG